MICKVFSLESKVIPFHWTKKCDKNNLPEEKQMFLNQKSRSAPIREALEKKNPSIDVKKILSWKSAYANILGVSDPNKKCSRTETDFPDV